MIRRSERAILPATKLRACWKPHGVTGPPLGFLTSFRNQFGCGSFRRTVSRSRRRLPGSPRCPRISKPGRSLEQRAQPGPIQAFVESAPSARGLYFSASQPSPTASKALAGPDRPLGTMRAKRRSAQRRGWHGTPQPASQAATRPHQAPPGAHSGPGDRCRRSAVWSGHVSTARVVE